MKILRREKMTTKLTIEEIKKENRSDLLEKMFHEHIENLDTIEDEDFDIVFAILENVNTPEKVLLEVLNEDVLNVFDNDDQELLILQTLKHPLLPKNEIRKYAESENCYHRGAIASNPSTDTFTLTLLSNDSSINVVEAVAANDKIDTNIIEHLISCSTCSVHLNLACNDNLSDKNIEILANSDSIHVRQAIASRDFIKAEVLHKLSDDDSDFVLCAVAENANTSEEDIEKLFYSSNKKVAKVLASHAKLTEEMMKILTKEESD